MKRAPRRTNIADLDDKPGHLVRRAHQLTAAIFDAETSHHGVTPAQHVVMTALFRHPGVDQATLAALVALDKVTVGHIVTRLCLRGLVQRADSSIDRRARVLNLAPAGRKLLTGMQAAVRRSQARLLAPLSPAQKTLFFTIMRRIVGMTPPYRRTRP
jgi:DNA-binding MarR family transcriptional regulator